MVKAPASFQGILQQAKLLLLFKIILSNLAPVFLNPDGEDLSDGAFITKQPEPLKRTLQVAIIMCRKRFQWDDFESVSYLRYHFLTIF